MSGFSLLSLACVCATVSSKLSQNSCFANYLGDSGWEKQPINNSNPETIWGIRAMWNEARPLIWAHP